MAKTTDHVVAEMLQREAFQAMAKLWKPLQKLRRLAGGLHPKDRNEMVKYIEEMEKILVPDH